VRSYRTWIAAAKITSGPAFRSVNRHGRVGRGRMNAGSVARLIKRAAEAAALDPAGYAGHSLRAGFANQAFLNGAAEVSIIEEIILLCSATARGGWDSIAIEILVQAWNEVCGRYARR
jgi:hypothetical protein